MYDELTYDMTAESVPSELSGDEYSRRTESVLI